MPKPYAHACLALGAGFLVALSLPPWGIWPFAFLGVLLFEVSLGEHPSRHQRAVRGGLFAAGWLLPGMGWMWFLTAPGYVVAVASFAALHALAAVAAPTGPWRVVGRPLAHTVVEALRLVVPFGGVPLATLAMGQAAGPLLGIARIGGVVLLTWVVFQIGFALGGPSPWVPQMARARSASAKSRQAGAVRRGPRGEPHGAIGFAVCVGVIALAAVAPDGSPTGESLLVTAVQGGGPQGTRAVDTSSREVVERHLAATETIAAGSADLVLWPENVVDVPSFADSPELTEIAEQAARIDAPIAVGITEDVAAVGGGPSGFYNAQVIVTPDGAVTSRYDKVRRVPFGEYMPMRDVLDAIGAPVDQVPRDAIAGDGPAVLDLPSGERLAVVISWEVFFGSRARAGVDPGGQVIINPTNGSSYTGTALQSQQVASSRLRAVETGRWVVQAAPTGFSAFISDEGDVFDRTAVSEQRVIARAVELRTGSTWYSVLGDWPFGLVAVAGLALCYVAVVRRSRPSR